MEEDKCYLCEASEGYSQLYDGLFDFKLIKVCENCAKAENIRILAPSQSKIYEKKPTVYERLQKMSGVGKAEKEKKEEGGIRLDRLRPAKQYPNFKIREDISDLNMRDNFHWYLMRVRRGRGLTQERVASEIGEDVVAVKLAETGKLPEKAVPFIEKLEHYFGIKLRKAGEYKSENPGLKVIVDRPVIEERKEERKPLDLKEEEIDFSNPAFSKKVTIDDLRRLREKKRVEAKTEEMPKEIELDEIELSEEDEPEKQGWWSKFFGKGKAIEKEDIDEEDF